MKIQITSDVHLDQNPKKHYPLPSTGADVLVVAGDLGKPFQANFQTFVASAAATYPHVILVSGNHEYYSSGHTKEQIDEKLLSVAAQYPNVHYLLKSSVVIDGVTFLGTTLWSDIKNAYLAQQVMSDYSQIKKKVAGVKKKISPADSVGWHQDELAWLTTTLASTPGPVVVVTHHAPSLASVETYTAAHPSEPQVNDAYATNLVPLIASNPQIKYWVHGHVHHHLSYQVGATTVVANPVGYTGQLPVTPPLVLDL